MLKRIAGSLEKIIYPPEEYLFHKNSNDLGIWIIEDGSVSEIPSKDLSTKPIDMYDKEKNIRISQSDPDQQLL